MTNKTKLSKRIELKKGIYATITVEAFKEEADLMADKFARENVIVKGIFEPLNKEFSPLSVIVFTPGKYNAEYVEHHGVTDLLKKHEVITQLKVNDGYVNLSDVDAEQIIQDAVSELIEQAQEEIGITTKSPNQEAAEKNAKEIKAATEIVESAEDPEALMSESEKKAYLISYNNVLNEGGEGYLPRIITKEMYNQAKKVLEGNR